MFLSAVFFVMFRVYAKCQEGRNEGTNAPQSLVVRPPLRAAAPRELERAEGVPPLARLVPDRFQLRLGQ